MPRAYLMACAWDVVASCLRQCQLGVRTMPPSLPVLQERNAYATDNNTWQCCWVFRAHEAAVKLHGTDNWQLPQTSNGLPENCQANALQANIFPVTMC